MESRPTAALSVVTSPLQCQLEDASRAAMALQSSWRNWNPHLDSRGTLSEYKIQGNNGCSYVGAFYLSYVSVCVNTYTSSGPPDIVRHGAFQVVSVSGKKFVEIQDIVLVPPEAAITEGILGMHAGALMDCLVPCPGWRNNRCAPRGVPGGISGV